MNSFALSGAAIEVNDTNRSPQTAVGVIDWTAAPMGCLDPAKPNARYGMCSIHIDEWDLEPPVGVRSGVHENGYLQADVKYATEGKGGEFTVGLTRGTVLAVGGADVISVKAYFLPGVVGEPLVTRRKRVQATITWPTTINPKRAKVALPSISATAATLTAWFPIPRQAESMIVLSDAPVDLPRLEAHFATSNVAGQPDAYALVPVLFQNGMPIERGVDFVRFLAIGDSVITPVFTLWP